VNDTSLERIKEQEIGEIEELLDHPPLLWVPKGIPEGTEPDKCVKTERVAGVVETVETRDGDYGLYKVVVLVRKDRTRVQVAGFGTVLKGWLEVVRPGDVIGLQYLGSVPSTTPGFKDYDSYAVAVRRDGKPVSQSQVLGEYDEPRTESEALEALGELIEGPPS
jgi:hypothetical protein